MEEGCTLINACALARAPERAPTDRHKTRPHGVGANFRATTVVALWRWLQGAGAGGRVALVNQEGRRLAPPAEGASQHSSPPPLPLCLCLFPPLSLLTLADVSQAAHHSQSSLPAAALPGFNVSLVLRFEKERGR